MERIEKHTEGIWECNVYDRPFDPHVEISCHAKQRRIAMTPTVDGEDIANAQLIVTAVNAHDKLKEALEEAVKETERGRNVVAMANKECGFPEPQPLAWVVAAKALLLSLEPLLNTDK